MLTILEIVLTVMAWRRGWGARALIPTATLFAVAFLVGVAVAASGGAVKTAFEIGMLLDLINVGVLSCLVANPQSRPVSAEHGTVLDRSGVPTATVASH